jgi:hypothetical protein
VGGWVRSSSGATFDSLYILGAFFDANYNYISAINAGWQAGPTTTYQYISAYGTAPANAAFIYVHIGVDNQLSGTVYWDEVSLVNIDPVAVNLLLGGTFTDFIQLANTGKIYAGKSTFDAAATGFFLGVEGGIPKLKLGNADDTKGLAWDGSDLTIQGDVIVAGNIQANSLGSVVQSQTFPPTNFYNNYVSVAYGIIAVPADASNSKVLVDFTCDVIGDNPTLGTDQGRAAFAVRVRDHLGATIYEQSRSHLRVRTSTSSSSGSTASFFVALSMVVEPANLIPAWNNTINIDLGGNAGGWTYTASNLVVRLELVNRV